MTSYALEVPVAAVAAGPDGGSRDHPKKVQQKGTTRESKVHIVEDRLLWLDIATAIAHILWTMAIAQNVQSSGLPGQACISK